MTAEQAARNMLERHGLKNAHSMSSGDVVELANLIANHHREKVGREQAERDLAAARAARERAEGMYDRQTKRADMLARDAAHYHDRAMKAEAERDRLREVVREVEFEGEHHREQIACCPCCKGLDPQAIDDGTHFRFAPRPRIGHAPGCELAEALGGDAPESRTEKMIAIFREIEFSNEHRPGEYVCPICYQSRDKGHSSDCELAKSII